MPDVLIKDATVVDGSGSPSVRQSVAVTNGRISALGEDADIPCGNVIEAEGLVLSPGFIDIHTHYDGQVFWDGACQPSVLHGVTTIIGGNCGMSLAPIAEKDVGFMLGLLSKVEAIPLATLEAGVAFRWRTFDEMLSCLDGEAVLNVGFLVGHSALRRAVMGERASESAATDAEIDEMGRLLAESLDGGGLGLSSSTARAQFDGEGRPTPPKWAKTDEFFALAEVCRAFEGTSLEFIPGSAMDGFTDSDAALMVGMSTRAGRPVNWNSLTIAPGAPDIPDRQLAVSDTARADGGTVVPLVVPHNARWRMDFGPGNLGLRLVPGCEWLFKLSPAELVASLRTAATRTRVRDAFTKVNDGFALTIVKSLESWVINDIAQPLHGLLGRTVGEIASERGNSPLDSVLDLAVESDLDVGFIRMRYLEDDATWEVREKLLKDPRVVLGASDAGAHVDSIANAEYPTAALKELVRQRPVFGMEELIRLMTSVPAELYGLSHRGTIAPGAVADLVLFDPLTVGPDTLHFAHDFPGGVSHLTSEAIGIDRVFVRGVEVVKGGSLTGAHPGQVLRSGRDTTSA